MLTSSSVSAASTSMTLEGPVTAKPGEEITVKYYVTGDKLAVLVAEFKVDSSFLKLNSFNYSGSQFSGDVYQTQGDNSIQLYRTTENGNLPSGKQYVATIKFQALKKGNVDILVGGSLYSNGAIQVATAGKLAIKIDTPPPAPSGSSTTTNKSSSSSKVSTSPGTNVTSPDGSTVSDGSGDAIQSSVALEADSKEEFPEITPEQVKETLGANASKKQIQPNTLAIGGIATLVTVSVAGIYIVSDVLKRRKLRAIAATDMPLDGSGHSTGFFMNTPNQPYGPQSQPNYSNTPNTTPSTSYPPQYPPQPITNPQPQVIVPVQNIPRQVTPLTQQETPNVQPNPQVNYEDQQIIQPTQQMPPQVIYGQQPIQPTQSETPPNPYDTQNHL